MLLCVVDSQLFELFLVECALCLHNAATHHGYLRMHVV
jgi:hypothetical protein